MTRVGACYSTNYAMATSMASIDVSNTNIINDITRGLPSLQFEKSLTDDEESYLKLRTRSHVISVSHCAQATYFAGVLNIVRQNILVLQTPPQTKASKLLRDAPPRDPFYVGIIGCGRLGTHLANCLLTYADVQPSELLLSTRRPELLTPLAKRGVRCFHDNLQLVKSAHLIFLCILPSHLPDVAQEVKGHIPASSTVYSFLSSTPLSRLRHCLEFPCIVKADLTMSEDDDPGWDRWDCSQDMCTTLGNHAQLASTSPLNINCLIKCSHKLAELILYTLVNLCTRKGLSQDDTVALVNRIVLGQTSVECDVGFTALDFTRRKGNFPIFDIAAVASRETPLTKTILHNKELRELFLRQYINIFDEGIQKMKASNNDKRLV